MDSTRIKPFLAVTALTLLGACAGSETEEAPAASAAVSSAAQPDTTGAAIWAHLQDANYQSNWRLWPGKGELYAGNEPHGMLLTTYLNEIAMEALTSGVTSMPPGAIVVKENYMPDSTLAAVTVMYKSAGYDEEHNDWFFTKHLPSGELAQMPNGMAMEGRLPGCQNCHGNVAANDYLFSGQLGAAQ